MNYFHSSTSKQSIIPLSPEPERCGFCANLSLGSALVAHVSKVDCGHKAWASVVGNEAASARILPSVEKLVIIVTWKGSTLMVTFHQPAQSWQFHHLVLPSLLSHFAHWLPKLLVKYRSQLGALSCFPLQQISWVHQEKGGGFVGFFPSYTAGTLKRGHHLILKDSE